LTAQSTAHAACASTLHSPAASLASHSALHVAWASTQAFAATASSAAATTVVFAVPASWSAPSRWAATSKLTFTCAATPSFDCTRIVVVFDLLARLAGVQIQTPALRDRIEDVPSLFTHFLPEALRARPASADFVEGLLLHPWPQNVRELARLAERLCVLHPGAPRWELAMLDEPWRRRVIDRGADAPEVLHGPPSREELLALLDRFDGNVSLLAKHVGRNRKQVYRWMDDLGVSRGTGRGP
jgi:hypothetical protein